MKKHNRRSIRLPGYDYTQPGWYYVTICTFEHHQLFGRIDDGCLKLNRFGEIVEKEWLRTAKIRENIELDEYVIMPNHMHGIIQIVDKIILTKRGVGAHCNVPLPVPKQIEQFGKSTKNSIPTLVKLFKSTVTKQINQHRKSPGLPLWQRGYYEHIIRNEDDLDRIRKYIMQNPRNWTNDRLFNNG